MVFIAILDDIARDAAYEQHVGELTAHQISTFVLIILFVFYVGFVISFFKLHPLTRRLWSD